MRKLKLFDLLKIKEKIVQQESVAHLTNLTKDADKCSVVDGELDKLVKESSQQNGSIKGAEFKSIRHLRHKMMDQREVINNRLNFLEVEKTNVIKSINISHVKSNLYEEKKLELKRNLSLETDFEELSNQLHRKRK